jgi:hypothetical protein
LKNFPWDFSYVQWRISEFLCHHNRPVIWLEQGFLTLRELIRLFPLLMQWTASNTGNAMSHLGYKQTFSRPKLRSALHPASDILDRVGNDRL